MEAFVIFKKMGDHSVFQLKPPDMYSAAAADNLLDSFILHRNLKLKLLKTSLEFHNGSGMGEKGRFT